MNNRKELFDIIAVVMVLLMAGFGIVRLVMALFGGG